MAFAIVLSMKTPFYNLSVHANFWLLPKGFLAITLFGHIFFRFSKPELDHFLSTPSAQRIMHHEFIHVLQARSFKTRYLGFYLFYLYYHVKGCFRYGFRNRAAYFHNPFEREAYAHDADADYLTTHWRDYRE